MNAVTWTPMLFGAFFWTVLILFILGGGLMCTIILGRLLHLWDWTEDDITDELNRSWADRRGLHRG